LTLATPKLALGERLYAIGDVHGCLDLFGRLVGLIRRDNAVRPPCRTKIVLLGDMIDRGPNSAELVRHLRQFHDRTKNLIVLQGNHEATMVEALRGNLEALSAWLNFGGRETLLSWGVPAEWFSKPVREILAVALSVVKKDELKWLDRLPLFHRSGDFFFVHAGIRPGVNLGKQYPEDMLWIRDEFLQSPVTHSAIIVHGHTVVEDGPMLLHNRIAIDTGAYRTGKLSAVGFEGSKQWTLST
jgi:serine/threonine protein phosphatase 1